MKTKNYISIALIWIFLLASSMVWAQTYTSLISSSEDDSPLGLIADHSDGAYLVSWRGTFDPYATDPVYYFDNFRNIIFHFDEDVTIIDSIEIDVLGGHDWSLWDLVLVGDSLLAWGTTYNEMNESCHLGLLWLDENLQVLDYIILGDYSDTAQFMDFSINNQGNMIFAGFHNYTHTLYLIKTHRNGEFIMENSIPQWGIPYPNICYLPASDQIMCGRFNWIGFVNNSDLSADTFYLPDIFTSGYHGDGWYIKYDESSAILPGLALKEYPEIGWNFGCIIFDTIAQVRDSIVFNTNYDQNVTMEVDYNTTDSIFFGGLENYISYNPGMSNFDPVDRSYYVSMFNFDGDRYWTLHLGGEANYSLMCLTILKNNDCLVAGARYDWRNNPNLERDIYLYKISSNGVLVNIPESETYAVRIFPNPTSDYLNVHIRDIQGVYYSNYTLSITDIFGNSRYTTDLKSLDDLVLDVSDFSPGIYIIRIEVGSNQIISRKIIIILN